MTPGQPARTTPQAVGPLSYELTDGPLTITDFVRYQGASGDMNPIHHDTVFAQAAGFDRPFAVGMRQAGVLARFACEIFGPENLRDFRVQFRTIAWPGDVITYRGAVTSVRDQEADQHYEVELTAVRQTGDVHMRGWAIFVVPASAVLEAGASLVHGR